jgi:hypothetical protein
MPSYPSGLGFFLFSSFCLVVSAAFSCKNVFGHENGNHKPPIKRKIYNRIHNEKKPHKPARGGAHEKKMGRIPTNCDNLDNVNSSAQVLTGYFARSRSESETPVNEAI